MRYANKLMTADGEEVIANMDATETSLYQVRIIEPVNLRTGAGPTMIVLETLFPGIVCDVLDDSMKGYFKLRAPITKQIGYIPKMFAIKI